MNLLLTAYSGGLAVLGLLQLLVFRRSRQGLQGAMTLCCFGLIPYLQGARLLYGAESPEAFAGGLTLQVLAGGLFIPAYVWFVVLLSGAPLRSFARGFSVVWPLFVLFQATRPFAGMYEGVRGLRQMSLPGVGVLSQLDADLAPFGWIHYGIMAGLVCLGLALGVFAWRAGKRKRGALLMGMNALLFLGLANDALVDSVQWPLPYLTEFALATFFAGMGLALMERMLHYEKLEERLHDSEKRYRLLIESIPHATFIADQDGRIVYMSRFIESIMGQSPEEIQRLHPVDIHGLLHPEDAPDLMGKYQRFVTQGEPYQAEFRLLHRDGRYRRISARGIGSYEEAGRRYAYGIFTDVTELRRLEEQLRNAEKLQAIGQLAGGVSHDFNNQLAAILSATELLSLADPAAPPSKRLVDAIRTAAERGATLTRQLLAFARKGKLLHVPVDMNVMAQEAAEFLRRSIDKSIGVEVRPSSEAATVGGDPSQIQNALLNLGINARDAQPAGGLIRFTVSRVEVGNGTARPAPGLEPGSYVLVQISDRGEGMDPATASHLFEPFFTTKDDGRGTGLGMAAVEGAVKSHGGAVAFQTQPGEGTSFYLYFPAWTGRRLPDPPPKPLGHQPWKGGGVKALVVDDESLVLEMMGQLLHNEGFTVEICCGGREALERFEASPMAYALLVTDLMMPGVSGHALQERARILRPDLPILLLSGYNVRGIIRDIRWDSRLGFLQKPFSRAALLDALARLRPDRSTEPGQDPAHGLKPATTT